MSTMISTAMRSTTIAASPDNSGPEASTPDIYGLRNRAPIVTDVNDFTSPARSAHGRAGGRPGGPTAPVVMTYRVAVGAAPGWRIVTTALVTALAIWALVRIAGRVYSGALLRFGGRTPLRDLLRPGGT